jgi:hypothetical protein
MVTNSRALTGAVVGLALGVSAPVWAESGPVGDPIETLEPAPEAEPTPAPEPTPALTNEAQVMPQPGPVHERSDVVLGVKVGGGFSQVTSELGSSFVAELEVGYLLPFWQRALELFVSGQYTAPGLEGRTSEADPRLPGDGLMGYELTQEQVVVTLGLLWRIPIEATWLRPTISLGGRMYLMRTTVSGEAGGEDFGTHEETSTRPGFYAALGADFFVGPGAIVFEAQFGYASVDQLVLTDTNVGALNLALGYRLFL